MSTYYITVRVRLLFKINLSTDRYLDIFHRRNIVVIFVECKIN